MSELPSSLSGPVMEKVANEYAFYVSQTALAKEALVKIKDSTDELEAKANTLKAETEAGKSALADIQQKLKRAEAEFRTYEKRESEKLTRLKSEAENAVKEFDTVRADLEKKKKEIEDAELDVRRGKFQVESSGEEMLARKAQLDRRERSLKEGEEALVDSEKRVRERENSVQDREESVTRMTQEATSKKSELEIQATSLANRVAELNSMEKDLSAAQDTLAQDKITFQKKKEELFPFVALHKEFKELAIQHAGDDKKIKKWLSTHADA